MDNDQPEKYVLHEKLEYFKKFKLENPDVFDYIMKELCYTRQLPKMDLDENMFTNAILKYNAKSEYQQVSIIIIRDILRQMIKENVARPALDVGDRNIKLGDLLMKLGVINIPMGRTIQDHTPTGYDQGYTSACSDWLNKTVSMKAILDFIKKER